MKYTNNKNNVSEILKVYLINSIAKSYILNIKIRPLVTEYALTIKLVGGTCSAHSLNPNAYFGHSWFYFDIQNLRLVILYIRYFIGIWISLYKDVIVGEFRRRNQKWTIQRNWQHRVHKTKRNKTKTQHNRCWTPLYSKHTNNVNKTSEKESKIGLINLY